MLCFGCSGGNRQQAIASVLQDDEAQLLAELARIKAERAEEAAKAAAEAAKRAEDDVRAEVRGVLTPFAARHHWIPPSNSSAAFHLDALSSSRRQYHHAVEVNLMHEQCRLLWLQLDAAHAALSALCG